MSHNVCRIKILFIKLFEYVFYRYARNFRVLTMLSQVKKSSQDKVFKVIEIKTRLFNGWYVTLIKWY